MQNGFAQQIDSVKQVLIAVYQEDQSVRQQVPMVITKYGTESSQFDSINFQIKILDSLHQTIVVKVLNDFGWLNERQIGYEASRAIFYTIQHSNFEIMNKYFPLLKKSVIRKNRFQIALMEDRIKVLSDQNQIYGTQYRYDTNTGCYYFFPISDIAHVDKRRKKYGFDTLLEYASEGNIKLPDGYKGH